MSVLFTAWLLYRVLRMYEAGKITGDVFVVYLLGQFVNSMLGIIAKVHRVEIPPSKKEDS